MGPLWVAGSTCFWPVRTVWYGIFESGVVLRYHVIPGETVFMMYRVVFEETSTRSHFFECCLGRDREKCRHCR